MSDLFNRYFKPHNTQSGFGLLEVLVAALVAAVAVVGVMSMNNQNLREVADNAELSRSQMLLSNMAQRMSLNPEGVSAGFYNGNWAAASVGSAACFGATCSAQLRAISVDIPAWRSQVSDAGLAGASLTVSSQVSDFVLQIDWLAHDAAQAVWRGDCVGVALAGRHCVALKVRP